MGPLTRLPHAVALADTFSKFDDFLNTIGTGDYTKTATDSGTVLTGDAANGIVTLTPSDGSVADNDEVYLQTVNEVFLFANGKPMIFGAYVQFTEAATNAANVAFGVANAPVANTLIDDGGGIRASGSLACIYKVDGETAWRCTARNQSTVTISLSDSTAGGTPYQYLEIEVVDFDSSNAKIVYRIGTGPNDTTPLRDSTTKQPIVHYVPYASATEMALFLGSKNGTAAQQTFLSDFIWWNAKR